jgi:hypothetical protein
MGGSLYICIMNYKQIHDSIIDRAKTRVLPKEVYTERHHIIPRCMGGSDDKSNLVDLTAKEHFVVHKLLAYIHGGKLWYAFKCMMTLTHKENHERTYKFTSREYEEARVNSAITHSKRMVGENNPQYGVNRSDEHKLRLSLSAQGKFIGKENPFYGKKHNDITRDKLSLIASQRVLSDETKEKIRITSTGRKHNDETKTKLSKLRDDKKKKVSVNGVIYESVTVAAHQLGINRTTFICRLKSNTYTTYFYI